MGTPRDWLRTARTIGTYTPPQFPSAPGQAVADPDPVAEFDRDRDRQSRLDELAERREEAREERELKRLARQAKMLQYEAQIKAISEPKTDANDSSSALMRDVIRELADDKKELLAELRATRAENAAALTTAVNTQLKEMQTRIERLGSGQDVKPISQLVQDLQAVAEVREALDKVVPPPPVQDVRLSRAERLEELRITEEVDIRKRELDLRRQQQEAAIAAAEADRSVKKHRMDRAAELVENTLGPVLANLGGDKIAGLMGGGGSGGGSAEPPRQLPYTCPNPACGATNHVPEGQTTSACQRCGVAVILQPPPPPPPPDMPSRPDPSPSPEPNHHENGDYYE